LRALILATVFYNADKFIKFNAARLIFVDCVHQLLNLLERVSEAKSDEGLLELFNSNRTTAIVIKTVKTLSQLNQLSVREPESMGSSSVTKPLALLLDTKGLAVHGVIFFLFLFLVYLSLSFLEFKSLFIELIALGVPLFLWWSFDHLLVIVEISPQCLELALNFFEDRCPSIRCLGIAAPAHSVELPLLNLACLSIPL